MKRRSSKRNSQRSKSSWRRRLLSQRRLELATTTQLSKLTFTECSKRQLRRWGSLQRPCMLSTRWLPTSSTQSCLRVGCSWSTARSPRYLPKTVKLHADCSFLESLAKVQSSTEDKHWKRGPREAMSELNFGNSALKIYKWSKFNRMCSFINF